MNLATMQFMSKALGRHVTYSVILPEEAGGPFPVLMQLHGRSDDHTAWIKLSNLVRHARKYKMIIVLPDGAVSFYVNLPGQRYEDFLMEDIWKHVSETFHVRPGPWAIGGLSMGGYGALRLGMKYPDRFASIWGHSGWYPTIEQMNTPDRAMPDLEDADVFGHASRLARAERKPAISFDCGTEDFLIEHNRNLHAHMDRIGLAHHYAEHPGAHTWDYWDDHVREALEQHNRVLKP